MSPVVLCLAVFVAAIAFVIYVIVSEHLRLRDAKRFVAAILSNQRPFIDLVQGGRLLDVDLAELMIRSAAQKLNRRLHERLRRALNERDCSDLVFEIAIVSKVLTDKRDLHVPKITISNDAVLLHDLFLISGNDLKTAA